VAHRATVKQAIDILMQVHGFSNDYAQVESLRFALDSSRQIGAAVGVLMARRNLTYAQAVDQLKTSSTNSNRKPRDLAAEVLLIGQLKVDY
jgi:AmiR/NasT family two-component response regulator